MTKKVFVAVSGAHRNVKALAVGVSGAWRNVKGAWVGVSGAWKQVFDSASFNLTFPTSRVAFHTAPGTATASLSFFNTGAADPSGLWADVPPTPAYVKATVTSGSMSTGVYNSWLDLSISQSFTLSRSIIGTSNATVRFDFSSDGANVAATRTTTFTATTDN